MSFFNEINFVREYDKYIITYNAPSKTAQEKFENLGLFIVFSKKESVFNNIKYLNKIMKDMFKDLFLNSVIFEAKMFKLWLGKNISNY